MRLNAKSVVAALIVCGIAACLASGQREVRQSETSGTIQRVPDDTASAGRTPVASRTLTTDDGLAVIAAALDARVHRPRQPDCSHLVHAIYDLAGFPYRYAKSSDLYAGVNEFQRVPHPQAGDLAVWRGHVGIVVNPAEHVFFSALRSGLGVDAYDAPYWKDRGQVRFYRYLKHDLRQDTIKARDRHVFSTHP
jgi:cell wall-associated NlpC family hydrolase